MKLLGVTTGPREIDNISNRMFKILKDKHTITEKQKEKYDAVKAKYDMDDYKMSLVKTSMKIDNVLSEIEYIESTGGLTPKQSKEYAKLREFGAINGWDLDALRAGKTAQSIIKEKMSSQ